MKAPNAQMQMILDAHQEMGPLPIETLTPEQARQIPLPDRAAVAVYGHHFSKKALVPMPLGVGKVEHRLIPGAAGDIMARVYTPKGNAPKTGWPMIVYFHGGGWVIATLDTYDSSARALCDLSGAIVVSVHYRQAPEHPWPAATEDALSAYKWVCEKAESLQGDADCIAVAGESAGGNLAAVVAIMARDKGLMAPVHQLLVYPVTDVSQADSPSAQEFANAKPLNQPMLSWFYGHYAQDSDRKNPYMSPLYADLTALPPATIILAEIDPLRSDGEAYADKLRAAGVPVRIETYEGVSHEFFGMMGLVNEATAAMKLATDELKDAFENHPHRKAA